MCLTILNVKKNFRGDRIIPLVAEKNITCFKILKEVDKSYKATFRTPHRGKKVRIGRVMEAACFTYEDKSWSPKVYKGIHAYVSKEEAKHHKEYGVIAECIIPKNTRYHLGVHRDIVARKMRLKKVIYRNRKWLK